jgi:hypothetical protein
VRPAKGVGSRERLRRGGYGVTTGGGVVWPSPIEPEELPQQSDEHDFVEKPGWYHGKAPSDNWEIRALYCV